ncbi:MAG: pyridoxal-phosphate-dependent aminotransferase family protein [Bacilli bacterium]
MKLFCPGPVMISDKVKTAMINTTIGHRSRDFETIFNRIKANILKISNAPSSYETVILSSSGSSANEAVIASLFNKNDKILILSNGSFGERIAKMMHNYCLDFHVIKNNWGEPFDITKLSTHLKTHHYDYLFVSHDETSSGLLNPIDKIGTLCKTHDINMFVDCVSSFISDEVNIIEQNIAIMTGVSGKAIGAIPGASFIVMKKDLFEKTLENNICSSYLNIANYYKFSQEKSQTPNTPNITSFIALDIALIECINDNKQKRYITCSNYLRDEFEAMNIQFLIDRSLMSNTVTTIILPKHFSAQTVYDMLYNKGYTTYLTRGVFQDKNCLQICVMGEIYLEDCIEFIKEFKNIINSNN